MTIIQSFIQGIIQGTTEFIPISSSGHLVIAPFLFGWNIPPEDAFIFNVLVQVATLTAVFAYFWEDISDIGHSVITGIKRKDLFGDPTARYGYLLLLSTIPSGVLGLFLKKWIKDSFASPAATASFLLITAIILFFSERSHKNNAVRTDLTWRDALFIGIFQVFAVFPGISRSGVTISAGFLRKLNRPVAAKFSFLMSIPIMIAAGAITIFDLFQMANSLNMLPTLIVGFISASITGYLSIKWLLNFLRRQTLNVFAAYCLLISAITFIQVYS